MKEYIVVICVDDMNAYARLGYAFKAVLPPGLGTNSGVLIQCILMERDKPPTEAEAMASLAAEQDEYEAREEARAKAAEVAAF